MLFLIAIFIVGVLSGATAAVIGFGIGSLLTPLLVTRMRPDVAVAVVALPHLIATAIRFVQHRRAIDRNVLRTFGVWSAVGGLAGALAQARFQSDALILVLGLLLVATGAMNLIGRLREIRPGRRTSMLLGLLSGVFGGLAGNQGGLRAAGLSAFDLGPRGFLATSTAVALIIDLARTPVYIARVPDELTALAIPIAVATAGCIVGTIAGERLFLRLPAATYRRVVGAGVAAVGIWLIAGAVSALR